MAASRLRRIRHAVIAGVLALLALAGDLTGQLEAIDRAILEWRYRVLADRRPASVLVVEIDAQSVAAIGMWPFPRSLHAQALDRLLAAGAHQVAFDVDFSTPGNPTEDTALRDAIRRAAGRVILPAFVQSGAGGAPTETRPLAALAEAAQTAAVNIGAERDGRIWRYPVGAALPGGLRPTMAVRLAGTGAYRHPSFLIDYAVDMRAIRRLSFADIVAGRFDAATVAGRNVLIGATAVELGDYRAVPVAGNLPSVHVQALAFESIVRERMLQRSGPAATILGLIALIVVATTARSRRPSAWIVDVSLALALGAGAIAAGLAVQAVAPLALDSAAWLAAIAAGLLVSLIARVQTLAGLLRRRRLAMLRARVLIDAVVEDGRDGILAVDGDGTIRLANPAAADLLGVARTALIDRPLAEAWPAGSAFVALPAATRRERSEIEHKRAQAGDVVLDVMARETSRRFEDGEMRLQLMFFRDVTERHRSRSALAAALHRAEEASRIKSRFLATMSHELRTPLNAIMGFSELIRDARFGADLERYRDYAGDIHMSGEHLLQVINDILDLSRIEVGQVEIRSEPVDLGGVLEACARMTRDLAARQQVELTISVPRPGQAVVIADPLRTRQVLLNLLSNAIKFTLPSGKVSARVLEGESGRAVVEVSDNGIGMTPEEVLVALQPFRQVDNRIERRVGGAGLGLPIAKALAELQGGSLEIDSLPGRGTRVRVTFLSTRVAGRAA